MYVIINLKCIANSYKPLVRPGNRSEDTFADLLKRNKRRRERKLGEFSSVSSYRGGDSLI